MKLPLWITVLIFLTCWPAAVLAGPIFVADAEGAKIELYDEPCKLKDAVSNLPYRATWTEKGKVFEGCFGASGAGVVVTYWKEDKTVAAIPVDAFKRVQGV